MQAINRFSNIVKTSGVGFYIKDNISIKTRNDLTKNIVNMEVTFIELHRRNKNTPYLVAIAHQPSPYESVELLWLENFETLLPKVTTKWGGVIIITGDINIDFNGEQKESTERYKNILHSYNQTDEKGQISNRSHL